ncbi:MAG TPA: phospho-N-acetylmuramoyl-pentapeptide-transferase [Thermotogaceae bacterium]|nr:phospho-N-acetylmuramoyl-pentapeptide-transferase [Thermotogota bacterium]HEW91927.1 phospho-N-acetylmuramoyl-pentapeptide-transferase [Thermotogaceae bacterium]
MGSFFKIIVLFFGFIITYHLYPKYIAFLKKKNVGQFIRKEGPDLHNYKEGTPTIGGLLFISSGVVLGILINPTIETFILSFVILLFAFIGLIDDLLSVQKKDAEGLKVHQKLLLQFGFSALAVFLIQIIVPHTYTIVPFINSKLDLGVFYYVFAAFVIVAFSNSTNLTDGLDGLAGSVFLSSAVPLYFFYKFQGKDLSLLLTLSLTVGAFLFYNFKPAKIFMGDTGAIALGGLIGSIAVLTASELFLLFFAFIFFMETLSVVIQVCWYKLTKRRVFKMAPLHHHYELKGCTEESIVFRFSLVNLLLSLLVLGVN